MKKVSTVTAMQGRNIPQQKLTIGLDLGDRNSWYCVVDEAGRIQREQRVRTTAKALQEAFGAMPRSRIALEIGTHSPWISRYTQNPPPSHAAADIPFGNNWFEIHPALLVKSDVDRYLSTIRADTAA